MNLDELREQIKNELCKDETLIESYWEDDYKLCEITETSAHIYDISKYEIEMYARYVEFVSDYEDSDYKETFDFIDIADLKCDIKLEFIIQKYLNLLNQKEKIENYLF